MKRLGSVHNFKRCKGDHIATGSRYNCCRYVPMGDFLHGDPKRASECLFGSKSIWIRKGADRYE